jgi:hypothetical protein
MAEKWSVQPVKDTIVDDDEFLMIDSADLSDATKSKRVKFSVVKSTSNANVALLDESNIYDSGLTQDLNFSSIVNANNIGIGTDQMTGFELHISDMDELGVAQFRMTGFGGTVQQNMGQEFDWQYRRSTSGTAFMDIMVIPLDDGTNSNAVTRFGLQSGSTGNNNTQFFNSNGNQLQSQLGSFQSTTFFNRQGGNTAIGKAIASFQLDVNGDIRTTETFKIDSGGVKADGTVTIATPDLSTFAEGTVTLASVVGATHSFGEVTLVGVANTETITVNSLIYTAVTGTAANDTQFSIDGDDSADAVALAAAINSRDEAVVRAEVSANVITVFAITLVAATGDAITLAEDVANVGTVVSGPTLTGGLDVSDEVTLNELQYSPVTNPLATPIEGEFDVSGTNDEAAEALDDAINADIRVGDTGDLSSTVSTNEVTVITNVVGVAGNSITMSENTTGSIEISSTTLLGGTDGGDTVTLYSNLVYTAVDGTKADNTQFDGSGTNTETATDLADSINNDTRQGIPTAIVNVDATSLGVIVTLTASITGTVGQNVLLASSSVTNLLTSGANLGAGAGTDGEDANQLSIASGDLNSINSTVSFPNLSTNDTFALLGIAQTFSVNQTFGTSLIMSDGANIVLNTTNGTQIGTSTSQKLAFYGTTPIIQQDHIADPSGGTTVDTQARDTINSILAQLATLGLQASS